MYLSSEMKKKQSGEINSVACINTKYQRIDPKKEESGFTPRPLSEIGFV